jgi:hypothetical protein
METPNAHALSQWWLSQLGVESDDLIRALRTFNAYAEPFRRESEKHEPVEGEKKHEPIKG